MIKKKLLNGSPKKPIISELFYFEGSLVINKENKLVGITQCIVVI